MIQSRTRVLVGVLALASAPMLTAPLRAQPIQGTVRSLGFQANVASLNVVREGQWFPVVVELAVQTPQPIQCQLAIERIDIDGDRVNYTVPLVALTPDTGLRKVWCYAATLKEEEGRPVSVDVRDAQGNLITHLSAPAFESIGNDCLLVVDVSETAVNAIRDIDTPNGSYLSPNWGTRPYYRNVCVGRLPAIDLPDRWFGLESVDVIVWDEPNPDQLQDWQLEALLDWVRQGGQLVIGVGPAWSRLVNSPLGAALPLAGAGASVEVETLPYLSRRFAVARDAAFKSPVTVTLAELARGAQATLVDLAGTRPVNLVSIRPLGSGRVTAVAARLRDLAELGLARPFVTELLDLAEHSEDFKRSEAEQTTLLASAVWLYNRVVEGVEFRAQAGLRVLAAFAFVAAYIGLSTFASWWWLKKRDLAHLSWSVFAVFAIVAAVLSLGAVALSRGVTDNVHSVSFVDLTAGSHEARGVTYFGYRSPRRQRVDLSLPGEKNYLRPLASGPEVALRYATAERYSAIPGESVLVDTPMRATLKEFEARWEAELPATIDAELRASRETGRLTPESWMENNLGVPIEGGVLLFIDPRLEQRDGPPPRAAPLTARSDRKTVYGKSFIPPAFNVLAVTIGPLAPGQRVAQLGAAEYARYEQELARWVPTADARDEPQLPNLWSLQNRTWMAALTVRLGFPANVPAPVAAMMLASTRDLYQPNGASGEFDKFGTSLSTDGLLDVDTTSWLSRGQAVLLLHVEAPAEVHLHRDGEALRESAGRTLYRVRVPIAYTGRPPAEGTP
ncbi:MAG: hypothetical protein HRF50_10245 [Phycisphaerae bacterium]